jgi:hypothetical protein
LIDFVDLIVATHVALKRTQLPHAFGGALALGYVATPRGTVDIDVNVFVEVTELERVAVALAPLGYAPETTEVLPIAGARFVHANDPFPIDVFPSLDERYDEIARRVVRYAFGRGNDVLPFLSAEDLALFKLSFGRPQDWVDLDAIARARPELDLEYVERQVVGLRGPSMYPRVARLRGLLRQSN